MKTTKRWSKKLLVVLFSLALTFGSVSGVFAAPELFNLKSGPTEQKNAVFLDVGTMLSYLIRGGFGVGVGYERPFGDSWSGLIHVALGGYTYDTSSWYSDAENSAFSFQIDVHGRWYFFKTALDKAFVDLGLGYDLYSRTYKYKYSGRSYDFGYNQSSLSITPKAGWKFIFGKGFVVEPSLGYTIGIPLNAPTLGSGVTGYVPSYFTIGVGLGWAF
ncbi:hypothetical protein AGMMS49944_21530 [Spirochaetia bacterium]|nr:hypothetical protein AGMMS49944_21530 [Spirochaetia bacterium]